ncbi:MAG: indole-3-glycerol phosphate synthase TrpC [Bacteroidota bacterium]|nr:indole-3-glycerol phosphate synthase TrpC [Bacteroidota bacterium]
MNILGQIIDQKKLEVAQLKSQYSLKDFASTPFFCRKSLSLYNKITSENNISIIAEVKKASPSKGLIRCDFNHLEIANDYMISGASAISVLTDKRFFQGDTSFLEDIAMIRTIPILRKDFIIDVFQVYQAKSIGADAILLIAEALTKDEINSLTESAYSIGLEVLLEVHSEEQLEKVDFTLNRLLGINNRNLTNFVTDINTTIELAGKIPKSVAIVSESGFSKAEDIQRLKSTRVDAVLVGEHFMRKTDIRSALNEFRELCIR